MVDWSISSQSRRCGAIALEAESCQDVALGPRLTVRHVHRKIATSGKIVKYKRDSYKYLSVRLLVQGGLERREKNISIRRSRDGPDSIRGGTGDQRSFSLTNKISKG